MQSLCPTLHCCSARAPCGRQLSCWPGGGSLTAPPLAPPLGCCKPAGPSRLPTLHCCPAREPHGAQLSCWPGGGNEPAPNPQMLPANGLLYASTSGKHGDPHLVGVSPACWDGKDVIPYRMSNTCTKDVMSSPLIHLIMRLDTLARAHSTKHAVSRTTCTEAKQSSEAHASSALS